MQRFATLFVLGLLLAGTATAQPDRSGQDLIWARDIGSETITLDGTLSESVWLQAETVNVQWKNPLALPGSGSFFQDNQNPNGFEDPGDPIDATVAFLRKGNDLYIAVSSNDKSVGGARGLWNMDGVFMSMVNKRPGAGPRAEFFYSWWTPGADTTATGTVIPGISPYARSPFGASYDDSTGVDREAFDFSHTVNGLANDDFNGNATPTEDDGYTFEMMISVDSLGWDLNQAMARMPFTISVQDADYNWPQDASQYVVTRAWWENRWGNNFNEGAAYIAGDPSVTVTSGALPSYTEPEFTVPFALNGDEPVIDGRLDEELWVNMEPQFALQYQADPETREDRLPGVLAPYYNFSFRPGANTVVDPSVGEFKLFYRGNRLYLGLDTDDNAVNGKDAENGRDGFRITIRSLDSLKAGLNGTLAQLRMDFSIDSTGAVRPQNFAADSTFNADNPDALQVAVAMKGASTIADPTDIDEGYQMEFSLDLTSIGYPDGLGDGKIWIALTYYDGDALEDDTQSYGTWQWTVGEREVGASLYGFLDPNVIIETASATGPSRDGFRALGTAPNPATDRTQVRFTLDRSADVTVEVFDVLGRLVQTIDGGIQIAGTRAITVDTAGLSTGAYIYRVRLDDGAAVTGRMMVVR